MAINPFVKCVGSAILLFALQQPVYADDGDSNADAGAGFVNAVKASTGLILRVPINAQGEELVAAADLRLGDNATLATQGTDLRSAFDAAPAVPEQPQVTAADISRDSSTRGWFGGGRGGYRGGYGGYNGWGGNYYYSTWQPSYYSYGTYYNYGNPYYQNYYGYYPGYGSSWGNDYAGYRYYYYNRCW